MPVYILLLKAWQQSVFGVTRRIDKLLANLASCSHAQRLSIDVAAREKVVNSGSMRRHINPS
jgi:hypothetical protein